MKKLDEGQKIIAGIILGMGVVILGTQVLLFFANRQRSGGAISAAPAAPAPPAPVPGQI